MKLLAQIIIPALASLYFGLSKVWDLPATEFVLGCCVISILIIELLLRYVSKVSYDGQMVVSESESGVMLYSLEIEKDPSAFADQKTILFQVKNTTHFDAPEQVFDPTSV